ncbi:hypothetical protein N0B44_21145 [Roseibacterium beibuensis]|uniref:hypothetical protein n=1 Tax=[Roseibacterium] beibuensis TaxID=1193142 RepID=UPI00217E4028|nr:hypothetical protein [Roseibacterium beibuensis]MCS6625422.1 hypothetical protein [Roseibacterium beibuensis]
MFVAAIALFTAVNQAPASLSCDALNLQSAACANTPHGVVLADDQVLADRYAEVMTQGETRFRRHFGRLPAPYALLIGERVNPMSDDGVSGQASAGLQTMLRAAGARHVLPWFTPEQQARVAAIARSRGVEAEARAEGLEGEASQAAVAERVRSLGTPEAPAEGKESAVAHEFGHLWAVAAFWPDRRLGGADHYGGPAADWFDESSAVLMEDDTMARNRREDFRKALATAGGARPKRLSAYFSDPHPMAAHPPRLGAGQLPPGARPVSELPPGELRTTDGRVVRIEDLPPGAVFVSRPMADSPNSSTQHVQSFSVTSTQDSVDPDDHGNILMFYAQARVFADFLIETTGDDRIYERIAEALANGLTMDQWLAAGGEALNLGASVRELEQAWGLWLERRYPMAA